MINHISIGVRDIARSKAFYDATLEPLGYRCLSEAEDSLGYGRDAAVLWLIRTDRPVRPDDKSGLHLCVDAPSRKSIDTFHRKALAAGGRDNGAPGLRTAYSPNYYAAFVVDPDGYRLEAFCGEAAS